MKILELYAGSRSIGKAAEELGCSVLSTDIEDYDGIDVLGDILSIPIQIWVDFAPDIIWASPPCTAFSVASIGHHWTGGARAYIPKTEGAVLGQMLMRHTLRIIEEVRPSVWFMENPRGLMRKMPEMEALPIRHTVTYCQYGDTRMKPTDIWTNCMTWNPRPMCKNGAPCHEAAPRGAKTGTQGRSGAHDRSKIPHNLCLEVIGAALAMTTATKLPSI
jgi:site-specific DNA-cytosine methylase